jgi:hypothetical protein
VSSVQSNGLEPEVAASGEEARGVEDRVKTAGSPGVAAAAVPVSCIPAADDIRSKVEISIEKTEVNLFGFDLILRGEKTFSFLYLSLTRRRPFFGRFPRRDFENDNRKVILM